MISPYILLTIGFLFILSELMFGSFYLFFCGLGFIIVAISSFFIEFTWYFQLVFSVVISVALIFILKKPFKKTINLNSDVKDDFLNESGEGVVKEGMIYYKGTLWHFEDGLSVKYKDGDVVKISQTKANKAIIEI